MATPKKNAAPVKKAVEKKTVDKPAPMVKQEVKVEEKKEPTQPTKEAAAPQEVQASKVVDEISSKKKFSIYATMNIPFAGGILKERRVEVGTCEALSADEALRLFVDDFRRACGYSDIETGEKLRQIFGDIIEVSASGSETHKFKIKR